MSAIIRFRNSKGKLYRRLKLSNRVFQKGMLYIHERAHEDVYTGIITPYAGLINGAGFSAIGFGMPNDTIASHPGWSEFTGYSQPARIEMLFGPTTGASISDNVVFNINVTGSVRGFFMAHDSPAKGDTDGALFSAIEFPSAVAITNGSTVSVEYRIRFGRAPGFNPGTIDA